MEDQVAAGLLILDGGTRVRKADASLVRLEDLGVSEGDLANYYNKGEVDIRLAFKQHLLDNRSGTGSTLLASNLVRRLRAGDNVTITEDADGNLVIASTGGSSSIPATIATFLASGIEHMVATSFTAGASCTGTLESDIVKSDSYLAKNSSTVQLLGTTEGGVACFADTHGISSVAARNRYGEQGCIVSTNSALCDLVLKNNTGQRNIRLTGPGIMALGQVSDPSLYVADTGITSRKGLSVQGNLNVDGTMLAAPPWIGGFTTGIMDTTNVAKINLISTAATDSEIELGNNALGGFVKLQATPSDGNSVATNFKVLVSNTERLRVQSDATTITGGLTVSGTTNLGRLQCGEIYSAAFFESTHVPAAGFNVGVVAAVNMARMYLLSPTNSLSQIYLGSVSNLNCARIESIPGVNSVPSSLNFLVHNANRLILREATSSFTNNVDIAGTLDVTGNITAPNLQPVLTSVSDGGVFTLFWELGARSTRRKQYLRPAALV